MRAFDRKPSSIGFISEFLCTTRVVLSLSCLVISAQAVVSLFLVALPEGSLVLSSTGAGLDLTGYKPYPRAAGGSDASRLRGALAERYPLGLLGRAVHV